ncbi:MAG: acetyl-CoA carboxylase, carboxyltransferase subunit beta [Lachnospiraceae bacterium]|nr:acetyl-CoA carboxylase, carboxyltransferase subunit beta [Lachnospiraceae bacterium]
MSDFFKERRKLLFSLRELRGKNNTGKAGSNAGDRAGEGSNGVSSTVKCPRCKREYPQMLMDRKKMVCPKCGYHLPISAEERLKFTIDSDSFQEMDAELETVNPIHFPGYTNKIKSIQNQTGRKDGALCGTATVRGHKLVIAILDHSFMMGSMGSVVGEKITRAAEYAMEEKLPLLIFSCSGGARMQEGMFSLMQMAKTSAAIKRFSEQGGLYISVLTHPTMGGVSASFATLGDIMLAEPGALIGFAGPRVIEQTIGQKLPEGFQRAEFLQQHGFVDAVVSRDKLRSNIAKILTLHCY